MKSFARLFETERGQIVALRHVDSYDDPAILLMFDPDVEGLGVCSLAVSFADSDEGENKRDRAFDALIEEGVRKVVFAQIDGIKQSFWGTP